MNQQHTAEIIPFPRKPAPAPEAQPLTVSLTTLSEALETQRLSVEAWRSAVTELSECMKTLGASLDRLTLPPDEKG